MTVFLRRLLLVIATWIIRLLLKPMLPWQLVHTPAASPLRPPRCHPNTRAGGHLGTVVKRRLFGRKCAWP